MMSYLRLIHAYIVCYLTYDLIAPSPDLFLSFFLLLIKSDL